jgi:hypothetical protein
MRCDQARSSLYGGAGGWERVLLGLHLWRCTVCRKEAQQGRALEGALDALPRYAPSGNLLPRLLAVAGESPVMTETKEKRTMRRVVYVGIALAAIAALAVITLPGRGGKKDVRTILADVAQAMEQVTSMHTVGRDGGPQGMAPGVGEAWWGLRAHAHRYYDKGSGILLASRADLDSRQWWFYDSREHTLYRADLTPVMARATKAMPIYLRFMASGDLREKLSKNWPDAGLSVASEPREGRQVTVITCDRKLDLEDFKPPIHVTDRLVYEVDPATDLLSAERRYWLHKDGKQQLMHEFSAFEYDVPIPSREALLEAAGEVKEVQATVADIIENGDKCLVLEYQGKRLLPGSVFTTIKGPND